MSAANTGKLIISSFHDDSARERTIDFLCSCAKGASREAVAARLETLPITLGKAMPADVGNKMMKSLQDLGAEVVFMCDQVDLPVSPEVSVDHTDQQQKPTPAKVPQTPVAGKAAVRTPSKPAAKTFSANNEIIALVIILLVLVAGLCGATALYLPALKAASDPEMLLNKLLQRNADMNNKTCPRNLNPHLRLDGYEAGNKKMIMNYTLVEFNSTEVNGNDLRPSVSRDIRRGLCREKNSADLLKKGVAFVFAVHGKDGGLIFDYQVVQEDCDYDLS